MYDPFAAYVKERCAAVRRDGAHIILVNSNGNVRDP